jgi:hypothetical protein
MVRLLTYFLLVLAGQTLSQTVLKFQTSNLRQQKIDTVLISKNHFGPTSDTIFVNQLQGAHGLVKYANDTLYIMPRPYSTLKLVSFKKDQADTINIQFLKLNESYFSDTVIYTTQKKGLFSKNYRTTKSDTLVLNPKSKGSPPAPTCEVSINKEILILKLLTVDTYGYNIGCGKRASHSRHTRTHNVIYVSELKP